MDLNGSIVNLMKSIYFQNHREVMNTIKWVEEIREVK